ncbi:MAG: cytochrome B6-F complex subunit VI (PetL) [Coleofasciculaceae cyanobacterium SM2_3_26]|nr:cytochrome B6-F complex subunit VI (PetL) [Coleofasciculaceae cyanobacterium SM2_3_26]
MVSLMVDYFILLAGVTVLAAVLFFTVRAVKLI